MMKILSSFAGVLILFFCISGCEEKNENKKSTEWDSFVNKFIDQYFELNPNEAVSAGRHEYDGMLPDLSKDKINDEISWLHEMKDKASKFDSTSLNDEQNFERTYFLAVVDKKLFWMEDAQEYFKKPSKYSDAIDPSVYITREYAFLETRFKAYTKYATAVPKLIEQMKNNLQTPLPKTFAELGKNSFSGFAEFFKVDVPQVFSSIKDDSLQSEFKTANQKAINAAEDASKWFADQMKTANDSFQLGEDLYAKMLWKTGRVNISLNELKKIAEDDLNRNLTSLKEACKKYAPGKSIEECVLMINNEKPEGGPVVKARRQLTELKQFVIDKKIVSIPSNEEAKVEESPPYRRYNSAYIDIPGPYESGLPSIYYIAPPDPSWTKKEQQAYIPGVNDLLFTSVHEVWPGHFLQYLYGHKAPSKFEQIFYDYAFEEGWAHYAEEMMWNEGLGNGDPATHIGQLLNALLRNVRFISSIGLHTGTITVEESEKMFKEKAYQDFGNAKQQAARGTYDPEYLNYTLGKLMIMKLQKDWAALNPDSSLKDFHNKFLSHGFPPIPIIRKLMLGEKDDGKLFSK
ncbi:MAG: DUF885 domain-containing protein [Ignavibacteriaceae bacterium]